MSRLGRCATLLGTAVVLGCPADAPPEEQLLEASRQVSFGDISNLGPHRLEASINRAVILDGVRDERGKEQVQLVWRDWDNFQLARRRDGVIISQVLVDGGKARVRRPDGRLEAVGDVEPHRVELRMAWDVWSLGLSVFEGSMLLEHMGDSELDGRVASQYRVGLPAGEGLRTRRVVADQLEGSVWIDEATAVRLMAEVTGRWHKPGREDQINEVEVILVRTDFGLTQSLEGWGT